MARWVVGALALVMIASAGDVVRACGAQSDCVVGDRTYRIAMPSETDGGPVGAILYHHGWRANAAGVMAHTGLRRMADRLGVALIALDSAGEGWLIANAPRRNRADSAIELAGVDAVLADAARRFPIDPDRILAAGFSGGGMMTWTLACRRPNHFIGFAPIAGTFWAPVPEDCESAPLRVLHVHGTADEVVPLAGRAIADTRQGDVREAFAVFAAPAADGTAEATGPDGLACEGMAHGAEGGGHLLLCLHDGGHIMRPEWVEWAWQAFAD